VHKTSFLQDGAAGDGASKLLAAILNADLSLDKE
jgi:hypothetical protein